jgi:hypothetical protein
MNKKYIALIAVVVVIVVAIVVVALVILPGLFTPPVDISGINLSTSMTTSQLLPSTLGDKQLVQGSNTTETTVVTTDSRTFDVEYTSALFDGVTVHIIKAQTVADAADTLDVLYDDNAWSGSGSTRTKTNDWFTASKTDMSAFFWKSDVWVFGVDAENDTIRNAAASDFVQYLKSL